METTKIELLDLRKVTITAVANTLELLGLTIIGNSRGLAVHNVGVNNIFITSDGVTPNNTNFVLLPNAANTFRCGIASAKALKFITASGSSAMNVQQFGD